jgi:hypothetical protein
VLFLLCVFLSPLAGVIPPEVTAPVLVVVGYIMMRGVGEIDWRNPAIGIPALVTIGMMPSTYSITIGVGAGFRRPHRHPHHAGQVPRRASTDVHRDDGLPLLLLRGVPA